MSKLTKKNKTLKQKADEQSATIRRLQKELRNAQTEKAEAESASAIQQRSLMTMAQALGDQEKYIKQLEE